jgi:hypothetical protein
MSLTTVSIMVTSLLHLAACGRSPIDEPDRGPTVDAMVYALGFCSLECWRIEQCGLESTTSTEECEDACIDDALDALPGDPSWAEWIELRRCRVLEATCDGVGDEQLPPGAEAVCDLRQQRLDACEP